jgi:hypothetical protein
MKKVLSVLVVLGVVIAMAACGNKKAEEEARIQDSIEQARIQDSITQADALVAEQQRVADSTEQARIQDSIKLAEEAAKAPAKKTTVQKVKEAGKAVKQDAAKTQSLRGGGTSK